jgi:sulfate transport system ATP-binding protein
MGISVEGANKCFGDFQALDDVSIEVPDGSLTALLGPSGSGKSTLLRAIAGLETLDSGRVLIDGEDVSGKPAQKREVGFVFQHYAAFKHMTVYENVAFGLKIRKWGKARVAARVHELLDLVQLEGLAERYPSQLSGGQRQRMALARALAVEPQVLLLDEPFGALDAKVRKDLRTWLRNLHEETGVTTIFVTHDQEEAMDVAGQLVVMNQGRVEQSGSADELYEHPANEFVMSFVGEVNRLGDRFVRPHDMEVALDRDERTEEGLVRRIVSLGFEIRVEFVLGDGTEVWAQLTRAELQRLELREGQIAYLRPVQATSFNGSGVPAAV